MNIPKPKTGIYMILNKLTGKAYIGSTINVKNRLYEHQKELEKRQHVNPYLQRAWNKYGRENFEFIPLLYCEEQIRLFCEQKIMDGHKNEYGIYNIYQKAGTPLGSHHSDETKQKQSKKRKKYWENNDRLFKEKNSFYGKIHSEETKQKISKANKGRLKGNKYALSNKFFHTPEK